MESSDAAEVRSRAPPFPLAGAQRNDLNSSGSDKGNASTTRGRMADRLPSMDSASDGRELVDSDSISIPISLVKGLRRKSSSTGVGSSSSNCGGSGNNSDNSGIVSLGNNSFGFNFDSEEGMLNNSSPNFEADGKNGESDSDGNGTAQVAASSAPPSKKEKAEVSGGGESKTRRVLPIESFRRTHVEGARQIHHPPECNPIRKPPQSRPSSASLNSQRSGSSSEAGSGSGSNMSRSGSSGKSQSTMSSLSSASGLSGSKGDVSSNSQGDMNSVKSSHEAAAAAAVANLQSIANSFSSKSTASRDAKHAQQRQFPRTSDEVTCKSKPSSGTKRKAEDDDGNDSDGYKSDDEAGASRAPRESAAPRVPDLTPSAATKNPSSSAVVSASTSSGVSSATTSSAPSAPVPAAEKAFYSSRSDREEESRPYSKKKKLDNSKREERNAREKERSFRISRQIDELRNLLSSGGVIVPKGTKSCVLTEAANYIRMLQQHQYRSEIDRQQLVQQMQIIGSGALGPQAAAAIRHVAAQNGVWSLGNFGGVPPRSAMTYYQQSPYGVPGSQPASPDIKPEQPQQQNPPIVTKVEEHEYRFVFNHCSVGMAIASMGGAFIDCNQLFCQLSQYSKQEVCSMTIFNLTSRQDLQHAFDRISQMISPPAGSRSEGNTPPCLLRGAMKHRDDLGLSVALIKGDDGIAKCFCVTLIKNPSSPLMTTQPVPATADLVQAGEPQITMQLNESSPKNCSLSGMSSHAYTTG